MSTVQQILLQVMEESQSMKFIFFSDSIKKYFCQFSLTLIALSYLWYYFNYLLSNLENAFFKF